MKSIFVIVLLHFIICANATNYYFSSVSGNDSRTTTEAQDPSTPWKTLEKLNSFFSTLKPGDSVLLKRGETFYGSIIITKAGSAILPIVISAYGEGDKPVITSLITLGGWVSKGKGIWQAFDSTLGSTLNMVLLNGVQQEMGRFPNSDAPNKGYMNFQSHVGKLSITDSSLTSSINWKGAELVLRPRHWILHRNLITSHQGHTIEYVTTSPYEPYENYGYFIQNSIKTLDKPGEWYYDVAAKKLSVYFGSKKPTAYVVEASNGSSHLISSTSYSNIIFDNLIIKGSNKSGINILNGSNIHIQNCDVLFSGENGIVIGGHKKLYIENCTIANSNTDGIDMPYGVVNSVIRNNRILNTGIIPGMIQNGEGTGLGIYTNGDGNTIEGNEIRNTGFIGITFYGNDLLLKNNFIDSFCFVKDDGGGIYSHGGLTINTNRKIIGNIVVNGIGAGPGTDHFDKRSVTGIYMDANITDVEMTGNTVTTCYQGIFIQSSGGMVIKNNMVYDNVRQLTVIERPGDNPVRNSTVSQNIFFSKTQDQMCSYIMSGTDDIDLFGKFDSNYYARPLDDRLTIYNAYVGANGTVTQNVDLEEWKKTYAEDEHSKKTARPIVPYKVKKLIGGNKFITGGNFTNDLEGLAASGCDVKISNSGMLDGGYVEVTPTTSRTSSLYLKIGDVIAGKNYLLKYSLRGSVESNMSIGASLKQAGAPFATVSLPQGRKISKSRTENQLMFTALASITNTYLIFKVDDRNKYFIDNVRLFEADAHITNPDDSIRFDYNPTYQVMAVPLQGNYMDATGRPYLRSITLQPYTSSVLMKITDSIKNTAPTVAIINPVNNAVFTPDSIIVINATAADVDGSIAKVEFYNDSTLLQTVDKPGYNFTLDSLPPGKYNITAKAIDNNGLATTSAPVLFSVIIPNVAPTVQITSPANDTLFGPFSPVFISATAADIDGSVEKVEFYHDSTLLKTEFSSPYSFTLDSLAPGTYTITARAIDNEGLATTSAPVVYTMDAPNIAPAISITTPVNNAMFSPFSNVAVKVAASDVDGSIAKVEFYKDSILVKTDLLPPFDCTLDTLRPGNYILLAKATDNEGMITVSAPVAFLVDSVNVAPTVSITSPGNNAVFAPLSNVLITADAADIDGRIVKVEFYNDSTLLKTERKPPFDCTMDSVAPGKYTITARAFDNNGAITVSSPVVFTAGVVPVPPSVSIITPLNNATYLGGGNIYLDALAADPDDSINKVEFYSDTTLLFTATGTPYTYKWERSHIGNYTLRAKATDNTGLVSISDAVNISVVRNKPPTVNIITPQNSQAFVNGSTILIQADVTDTDGRPAWVEFYSGTTLLTTKYGAPFIFNWKNVPTGNYTITAKAFDNWGAATMSSPVTFAVIAGAAPVNSITTTNEQPGEVQRVATASTERVSQLSDISGLPDFRVMPNPAVNKINLNFTTLQVYQKAWLTIQNSSGIVLKKYPVIISGNKTGVDISSLSAGIYFIGLSGHNFTINKKFLKVN